MHKVIKNYDDIARPYHNHIEDKSNFLTKYVEEPGTLKKLSSLNLKNKYVLDLGCGSGRYTMVLKEVGAKVVGIDPSEKLLEIARKNIKGVKFIKASSEKLPFSDNEFDLVVAGMVLHYVKKINTTFKEISRILKTGGIFVFSSHVPYLGLTIKHKIDGKPYYQFDNYFKEGKRYKKWSGLGVKIEFYHHTMETLMKAAINNNFKLTDYVDLKPLKSGKEIDPEDYEEVINKSKFFLAEFTKE
jgi:ubiquinone/menaquinone biosynthesis C-methylase UbiE